MSQTPHSLQVRIINKAHNAEIIVTLGNELWVTQDKLREIRNKICPANCKCFYRNTPYFIEQTELLLIPDVDEAHYLEVK